MDYGYEEKLKSFTRPEIYSVLQLFTKGLWVLAATSQAKQQAPY